MDDAPPDRPRPAREAGPVADGETTVEAEVRAQIVESLGGRRGALETALPIVAFTVAYVLTDEVRPAVAVGVGSAVVLLLARLAQRSPTRFVRNGLLGIAVAAVFAMATGRAETAFLPGIIQNAAWAVVMAGSILVRRPLVGYVIGGVLGDPTGWRDDHALVRLGNRLTLVLLIPMVIRVAVQYPLYLAEAVGWLGVSRLALGWPVTVVALAAAGAILARGNTPMPERPPA